MKKLLLMMLLALVSVSFITAGKLSLEGYGSTNLPVLGFIQKNDKTEFLDIDSMISPGLSMMMEGYYSINDWFALGGVAGLELNGLYTRNGALFTMPLLFSVRLAPGTDAIRFPFSLQAGMHYQNLHGISKIGLSFGISAALDIKMRDYLSFMFGTRAMALLQFGADSEFAMQLYYYPVSAGFKVLI